MFVAVQRFDLRLPGCRSLKQKRHVVKTLSAAIRTRFNVSVAEVDHQDLWQRTTLAVGAVSEQAHHLRRVLHEVERLVEAWAEAEIIDVDVSLHDPDDE